jgi:DNA-binding CsgD family transcriptional regulator
MDPYMSPREKQLLRRLAQGKSDMVIAQEIGGKRKQIAEQRDRLLVKLCLSTPDEIALAASKFARWPGSGESSTPG